MSTPKEAMTAPGETGTTPGQAPITNRTLFLAGRVTRMSWIGVAGYSVIIVGASVLADVFTGAFGRIRTSIAQYPLLNSPQYFLMVFGIVAVTTQLAVFVAHGVTRRDFARGAAVFLAGLALWFAVVQVAVLLAENGVFHLAGIAGDLTQPHPAGTPAAAGRLFMQCLMVGAAHAVSGWLIGSGYYRYGPWLGTVLIVPGYLPAYIAAVAMDTGTSGLRIDLGFGLAGAKVPAGVLVSLAVIAAASWVCYALTRSIALRKITS